ncbi:transcriptional regulator [Actinocorallia longicatena]|uniref:Helix-turn-helix domain-containing protein n=1 Tax=Actinocorallia longicatena TaxID=111803 RepID=A0ABP6QFP4_9ACTN
MDTTLRSRRERLRQEWAHWVDGDDAPHVRAEIQDSWRRSDVDPARAVAPLDDETDDRWARSPLRPPVEEIADELRAIADDAGFIAAVTDESGTILWTCGGRVMSRRAGAVNFARGGRWDETSMGTNALALALKTGVPSTVFSAEHLVEALHGWVCYCAPIHSADGSVLGVLDISSTWDRSHPLGLPTVRGLVSAIEGRLASRPLIVGHAGWRLDCLGTPGLLHDGAPVRLRPRQLEILALLALEGRALSPEQLRAALYGDRPVSATTLKAEVSHLRRVLSGALSVRRYELTAPIGCDALDVLSALRRGRLDAALSAYRGPLLPDSDAPGVTAWRDHLEVALRDAVLRAPAPEPSLRYGEYHPDDLAVHERSLALLPASDPRRGLALSRTRSAR